MTTSITWLHAVRLHHWVKNLLLFLPLALVQALNDVDKVIHVGVAFVIFGLVASGTYLFNDLFDLDADRSHPRKCRRALAAGLISNRSAAIAGSILVVGGTAAAFGHMLDFGFCVLAYVVITTIYSLELRYEPIIDGFTIGGLFSLRLVAGMLLLEQPVSIWLSSFAFALFASLALSKRHAELVMALRRSDGTTLERGYQPQDLALTLPIGIGLGLIACLIMLIYLVIQAPATGLYGSIAWLYVIPLAILTWTTRIWIRAHRGLLDADPVAFALCDRVSWLHALVVITAWLAAIQA